MVDDIVGDVALRDELLRRMEVDQRSRRACTPLFAKAVDGMVRPADLTADEQAIVDRLTEVDQDNTLWLGELVSRRGWPIHSMVGEQAAAAAWLLAQHADQNPALQRRFLDLMENAPAGEVKPMHVAYLTDRVLLAEGKSQVYGTQMSMIAGEYQPQNLRDPETVDERRAAVGLSTLAEYRQAIYKQS
jgi:hypothetical protein